jgi:hypothetical protein
VDWQTLDWAVIFSRLVLSAFQRRQLRGVPGSLEDAEDLAAEAIRRLFDSNYAQGIRRASPICCAIWAATVNGLFKQREGEPLASSWSAR